MTMPATFANGKWPASGARGVAGWLCLAASPAFAAMAWIGPGDPMALCASGPGMPPMDGMTAMYLLMSLFHLPPWLVLVSRRGTVAPPLNSQTEGD